MIKNFMIKVEFILGRNPVKGDLCYLGSSGITITKKKPNKKELTEEEKNYNKEFSKERIKIEDVFGKIKIFQIIA